MVLLSEVPLLRRCVALFLIIFSGYAQGFGGGRTKRQLLTDCEDTECLTEPKPKKGESTLQLKGHKVSFVNAPLEEGEDDAVSPLLIKPSARSNSKPRPKSKDSALLQVVHSMQASKVQPQEDQRAASMQEFLTEQEMSERVDGSAYTDREVDASEEEDYASDEIEAAMLQADQRVRSMESLMQDKVFEGVDGSAYTESEMNASEQMNHASDETEASMLQEDWHATTMEESLTQNEVSQGTDGSAYLESAVNASDLESHVSDEIEAAT